jgi:hypothetical protein
VEWQPIAEELTAELVEIAPWARRPHCGPTVAAWARTEAQLVLVGDFLNEHGPLDGDQPRGAALLMAKLETQAQALRAELGLSPLGLARLMAIAERRGERDREPWTDQLNGEIQRLIAEGRRVLSPASWANELSRLTDPGGGGGGGRGDG